MILIFYNRSFIKSKFFSYYSLELIDIIMYEDCREFISKLGQNLSYNFSPPFDYII